MVRMLFVIMILCFSILHSQDISVKATVDAKSYSIGDHIRYSIEVKQGKSVKIIPPSIGSNLDKLELVSVNKSDTVENENGSKTLHYRYTIIGFDTGSVTIPALPIQYIVKGESDYRTVTADSILLHIAGVTVDSTAEIKDIKDPVEQPIDWLFVAMIAGIVLIVLIALYFVYRYIRKKSGQVVPAKQIVLTPYQLALQQLKELEKKNLWKQGYIKEYHTELTEIVRSYFEKTFSFPAMEQTSGEIIAELQKMNLSYEVVRITEQFLNNADMVKFAKFSPMPHVNEEMLQQAYKIIEEQLRISSSVVQSSNSAEGEQNADR